MSDRDLNSRERNALRELDDTLERQREVPDLVLARALLLRRDVLLVDVREEEERELVRVEVILANDTRM